jgi:thermopsin
MARSALVLLGAAALALVMISSALASASAPLTSTDPSVPTVETPNALPAAPTSPLQSASSPAPFGTNSGLSATVAADEDALQTSGHNSALIHPPNLHQAPPLSATHGSITPLYDIAPAPMGVGYYGLSDTTGKIQSTTINTTSLAGVYSTGDPTGTQTEEYDVSTGSSYNDIQPSYDSYGAQLNSVITNVTVLGKTSFYNPNDPDAPTGCPGYGGNPSKGVAPCPNEFWLQNYIEYVPSTHVMLIGDEIWNFSNPTASWGTYNPADLTDRNSLVGFGSIEYGLYFLTNIPSEYGVALNISYPFTLALYLNVTRGPCHLDTIPGTGVPSCSAGGSTVSTTEPVNEIFFNYSVWKSPGSPCPGGDVCTGNHVCPAVEAYAGIVCGEYDDIFFNSVSPAHPNKGVPLHGPHGQIGSAAIEANGSAYDPLGLTNDFEMDYGIGSDDGDTNGVAYADGTVGIDYCAQANTLSTEACRAYSATPSAMDFGGETGETSTGELSYWTVQSAPTGAGRFTPAGSPLAHLVTGPAILRGLWNMSGLPYPGGAGAHPLSYAHISPANAWVGIAAGAGVTNQAKFQVAPTFGWYSYWTGSGGAPNPTSLGSNLYLAPGMYTVEVLLSGYAPYLGTVDLKTSGQAPVISLKPDSSTGVYTPIWAFSNSDLGNISTNGGTPGVGGLGDPYQLDHLSPTVGAPFGVVGSISSLFSDLNDYLFPVWYGEFLNSTTAHAQSDPAPSFYIVYPSWQFPSLDYFGVPHTDQFQLYFFHVQNFTLAHTVHIYSWANDEAVPLASVVCADCRNDLFAGNSFAVSDLGLELVHGGSSAPSGTTLPSTRNVVWGNTFAPDPQPQYYGLIPPSTALVVAESFDRIYNNAFEAAGRDIATATSPSQYTNWWNATCQPGYDPLAGSAYPGPVGCEPLSYAQSMNGFTLTGSIIGSHYQGGNFWAAYGDRANPYGNIPFTARSPDLVSPGKIGSAEPSFGGDYAPLISTTVYKVVFEEHGLPASSKPTAFLVRILNSDGSKLLWRNFTATALSGPHGRVTLAFYLPNGKYQFQVGTASISGTTYYPHPAEMTFKVSGHSVPPIHISFTTHDPGTLQASVAARAEAKNG